MTATKASRDRTPFTTVVISLLLLLYPAISYSNDDLQNAIQMREEGKLSASIEQLNQLLQHTCQTPTHCQAPLRDNTITRIHLELGRSYLEQGNSPLARQHLSLALSNPHLPGTVKHNAETLLAQATPQDTPQSKHQFKGAIEFALGHDNNAGIGPEQEIAHEEGLDEALNAEQSARFE